MTAADSSHAQQTLLRFGLFLSIYYLGTSSIIGTFRHLFPEQRRVQSQNNTQGEKLPKALVVSLFCGVHERSINFRMEITSDSDRRRRTQSQAQPKIRILMMINHSDCVSFIFFSSFFLSDHDVQALIPEHTKNRTVNTQGGEYSVALLLKLVEASSMGAERPPATFVSEYHTTTKKGRNPSRWA